MKHLHHCLQLVRSRMSSALIKDLIKQFGNPESATEGAVAMGARLGKKISLCPMDKVEEEIEITRKNGADFITQFHQDYPQILANMDSSPLVLIYKGNIDLLKNICIGIVGSRNASLAGRQLTQQIASDLSKEGISVVSGLASGIDTEAHKGSIKTTVAVIAGGIDNIYPRSNTDLYRKIEKQGLILSERPYGSSPQGKFFPLRNRIIAGLCRGVIVVEAGERSGSLITANIATEEGREVFAVPNFPLDPRSKGTNKLIKEGATLVENYQDVLFALKWHSPQIQKRLAEQLQDEEAEQIQKRLAEQLQDEVPEMTQDKLKELQEEKQEFQGRMPEPISKTSKEEIFDLIGKSPVTIDNIISDSTLTVQEVQIAIIELALEGKVERQSGQKVARIFQL